MEICEILFSILKILKHSDTGHESIWVYASSLVKGLPRAAHATNRGLGQ